MSLNTPSCHCETLLASHYWATLIHNCQRLQQFILRENTWTVLALCQLQHLSITVAKQNDGLILKLLLSLTSCYHCCQSWPRLLLLLGLRYQSNVLYSFTQNEVIHAVKPKPRRLDTIVHHMSQHSVELLVLLVWICIKVYTRSGFQDLAKSWLIIQDLVWWLELLTHEKSRNQPRNPTFLKSTLAHTERFKWPVPLNLKQSPGFPVSEAESMT